jgi:hypothetical protein
MLQVGDRVQVLKDEGYDLPNDVQGKPAVITAAVRINPNTGRMTEFMIKTDDGFEAQAAFYHVIPFVTVRNPYHLENQVHDLDPDLHELILLAMDENIALADATYTTALFVLAHVGYETL